MNILFKIQSKYVDLDIQNLFIKNIDFDYKYDPNI